jgi:FixJ family two-component response regulator
MSRDLDDACVIVIDDDEGVREALQSLLRSVGLKVALYGSVADFLAAKVPQGPCCLVVDIRLPGMSGLDLQAELAARGVKTPIVFITGHGDVPMSVRAMKAGAVEFLTKPFRDQDLLDAIQLALARSRAQREKTADDEDLRQRYQSLTPRERQVFTLVTKGLLNKQIAGEIGVTEITVKVHRGQVMRKMAARTLVDLVRLADRLEL